MGTAERCRTAAPFSYIEPFSGEFARSALLGGMTPAVHGTVRAPRAAGAFPLPLLPDKVNGDGNDNGYQYNANKDSGKVFGDEAKHFGIHSFYEEIK